MAESFVPVQFLVGWRQYNPGEVAGFDERTADALCASDIAVRFVPATVQTVTIETAPTDRMLRPARHRKKVNGK